MLKELLSKTEEVLETLKADYPLIKIGRYKGEFEDGSEWSPVFPCVFQRLNNYTPLAKGMQREVLDAVTGITLYVADKDINSSKGLDLLEDVIELFNGVTLQTPGFTATAYIRDEGMELFGYMKGVEVYILQIAIT